MSDVLTELLNGSLVSLQLDDKQLSTDDHRSDNKDSQQDPLEFQSVSQEKVSLTASLCSLGLHLENDNPTSDNVISNRQKFDGCDSDNELDKENESKLDGENQKLIGFLDEAYTYGANAIDLSKKALACLPKHMNKLENLQFLYLAGNNLIELPLDFFSIFHSLQWLDLRNNQLNDIPTYGLNKHNFLKYLLLEYNSIKRLPFELGYVKQLVGLNLYRNPIEFPPQHVINGGVRQIKNYLRENDDLNKVNTEIQVYKNVRDEDNFYSSTRDVWDSDEIDDEYNDITDDSHDLKHILQSPNASSKSRNISSNKDQKKKLHSSSALDLPFGAIADFKVSNKSLRPVTEMRNESRIRMEKARLVANNLSKQNAKPRRLLSIQAKQYVKSDSAVYKNYELENSLKNGRAEKYMKKKLLIDSKLQETKDKEVVDEFREEMREKQRKMKYKKMIKNVDYMEPAKVAPFDVDNNHMIVMSSESRARLDQQLKDAQMRPISPGTLARIEEERRLRDHHLQEKIRDYTKKLLSKRQTDTKYTSAKNDRLDAAKDIRELKLIEKELEQRRMELQYNYKAYTGSSLAYQEMAKINANANVNNFVRSKPS